MRRPSYDAESAVLACLLRDRESFWSAADVLVPEDFHDQQNRALFQALVCEIRDGRPADAVTIGEQYPHLGDLAMDIEVNTVGSPRYLRTYAEALSGKACLRKLQAVGRAIAALQDPGEAFATARRLVADCEPRTLGAGPRHISEFARMSKDGLMRRFEAEGLMTGLATGYEPLDAVLSGWQPTDLIIVAARPSVGKSAFAMQSMLHGTSGAQANVGLFASLEMSGEQLSDRAISHLGGINANHIRQPKLMEDEEWARSTAAFKALQSSGLYVDDSSGLTVEAISARARQLKSREGLALIAIDYLTYIDLPKNDTQEQGIQHVTRSLKALAKELKVPVILLSQLNRDGDDEPELRHLRGSGAIEQDADVVIFLHRPDKSDRHTVKVKVAKNRNGALADFYLRAEMETQRFTPMDAPLVRQEPDRPAFRKKIPTLPRRGYRAGGVAADE